MVGDLQEFLEGLPGDRRGLVELLDEAVVRTLDAKRSFVGARIAYSVKGEHVCTIYVLKTHVTVGLHGRKSTGGEQEPKSLVETAGTHMKFVDASDVDAGELARTLASHVIQE